MLQPGPQQSPQKERAPLGVGEAARGAYGSSVNDIAITESEINVRFHRRAHLPIVLASGLIDKPVAVPWWNRRALRLVK